MLECQDPCTNVKPPLGRLSGDGSVLNLKLSTYKPKSTTFNLKP